MEDLLGPRKVIKATEVQTGDFLVNEAEQSTYEVIDVRVQPDVILVNLAVRGIARLDPSWDVKVYRKA